MQFASGDEVVGETLQSGAGSRLEICLELSLDFGQRLMRRCNPEKSLEWCSHVTSPHIFFDEPFVRFPDSIANRIRVALIPAW